MKKVSYVLGAVGLAPVVAGLAAPNAATVPSQASHTSKAGTKTASLNPLGASAIARRSCTGHISTGVQSSSGHNANFHFFYTEGAVSTCIGTVYGHLAHPQPQLHWRVRIWKEPANTLQQTFTKSGTFDPSIGIHNQYPNTVKPCAAWVKSNGQNLAPPICISVG